MSVPITEIITSALCFTTCGAWAEDLYQSGKDANEAMDYDKALQYYQQAAEQGNAEGLRGIGSLYAEGEGVEKDINKAMDYWQRAADLGDTKALINLGRLYTLADDESVTLDFDKGIEYLQKAIDLGDAEGLTTIGTSYYWGKAVELDYAKALEMGNDEAGERLNELEAEPESSGAEQPGTSLRRPITHGDGPRPLKNPPSNI